MDKSFYFGEKIKLDLPNNIFIKKYQSKIITSESEKYLCWFFDKHEIKYEREVEIHGLRNDEVRSRRADFYLPKFKMFVEFNGLYNESKEDRARYKKKMKVYHENRIPFIALYSDNIGALDYFFFERLGEILHTHKMNKQLIKYEWTIFFKDNSIAILVILGSFLVWLHYLDISRYYILSLASLLGLLGLIQVGIELRGTVKKILSLRRKSNT